MFYCIQNGDVIDLKGEIASVWEDARKSDLSAWMVNAPDTVIILIICQTVIDYYFLINIVC